MLNIRSVALALILSVSFLAVPAQANNHNPCDPRKVVLDELLQDYGETPTAIGITSNGKVLEVLVSKSGSWTIIISTPSGFTCWGITGENWELFPAEVIKEDPA